MSPLLFLLACDLNNAAAQDSGEERTIDVTEWQCWLCGKQFFTLTPDDINANRKSSGIRKSIVRFFISTSLF